MSNQLHTKSGVSYFHAGRGKWHFTGKTKDGGVYTKIEKVGGRENANAVAGIVAGSLKRAFVGVSGLDAMARGQLKKVVTPDTYKGIEFSPAYPANQD
jgi:hypothetical protein